MLAGLRDASASRCMMLLRLITHATGLQSMTDISRSVWSAMSERRVRVVIKNPQSDKEEGEHAFQTHVPLSWDVWRLKEHLHYRYPEHPAPELQRVRGPPLPPRIAAMWPPHAPAVVLRCVGRGGKDADAGSAPHTPPQTACTRAGASPSH